MNTTPATCKGSVGATCGFRTKLSKRHLKNSAQSGAEPRCSPVLVPAIPCFVVAAAVMKKPTTTNKLSEIMWSLLQGDDCCFLKERITEVHTALLPCISKANST